MIEINVTVKCPDLVLAATAVSKLLAGNMPHAAQAAQAAQAPTPAAPAPTSPTSYPASPVPTAPATQAPGFTLEQVGTAGANLMAAEPAKMQALLALLGQFGVSAIAELKPEQIGSFATALRGLGAKI